MKSLIVRFKDEEVYDKLVEISNAYDMSLNKTINFVIKNHNQHLGIKNDIEEIKSLIRSIKGEEA